MQIDNEFSLPMPTDEAFALLTDIERIAPCMPGAKLTGVDGDTYSGTVKVKVGPITAQYQGTATLVDADALAGRAVLEATGRETRGQGSATARITATLEPDSATTTTVQLSTELTITGKVAQVGRGVMADVSAKLLGQFADCLTEGVATRRPATSPSEPSQAGSAPAEPAVESPAGVTDSAEPVTPAPSATAQPAGATDDDVAPIDLLNVAGTSVAKRAAPVVAVTALVLILVFRRRRRRG